MRDHTAQAREVGDRIRSIPSAVFGPVLNPEVFAPHYRSTRRSAGCTDAMKKIRL
jgi:hypothetical protein